MSMFKLGQEMCKRYGYNSTDGSKVDRPRKVSAPTRTMDGCTVIGGALIKIKGASLLSSKATAFVEFDEPVVCRDGDELRIDCIDGRGNVTGVTLHRKPRDEDEDNG